MTFSRYLRQLFAAETEWAANTLNIKKEPLQALLEEKIKQLDYPEGHAFYGAFNPLPYATPSMLDLNSAAVTIGHSTDLTSDGLDRLYHFLTTIKPWRKGPFQLFGHTIDTEWRSDMKWKRLEAAIPPLTGKSVLDIGASSGYYMFRMAAYEPRLVLGIDPYPRYFFQFLTLQHYARLQMLHYLPVGMEDLTMFETTFDIVFCMGILYHQRSPLDALRRIKTLLKPGGTLILETIIIPGEDSVAFYPPESYARMTNVHFFPTFPCLANWLQRNKFKEIKLISVHQTTTEEQRKTDWINQQSLEDFLDPGDPDKTIEGYPAPQRAILTAVK